mgnify:CR=1 FL=1
MKKPLPYDPRSLHLIYSSLLLLQLVVTSVVLYAAQENAVITLVDLATVPSVIGLGFDGR